MRPPNVIASRARERESLPRRRAGPRASWRHAYRPDVGDDGTHAIGVTGDLLVEEPQGLPARPGRLGVALVIAPQVCDPGVPPAPVALEDQPAVGVGGINEPGDGADPRQRTLSLRIGKPSARQGGEQRTLELALRGHRRLGPIVQHPGECDDPGLAGPGDLSQRDPDVVLGVAPVEDQVIEHPAQAPSPERRGHLDHRACRAADR